MLLGLDARRPRSGNWVGRVRRAMTTSSREALPARSPRPLIVTSTWRAPAWTAASVLAVASPRSLWQWTLTVAWSPTRSTTRSTSAAELGRDGVADRVRDVDRRRRRPRRPPRRPGAGSRCPCARRPRRRTRSRRRGRAPRGRGGPSGPPRPAPVSRSIRSLCLRWMSLVAMNTWRCGRWATLIASIARCGSPSRQRARAATAMSCGVSWAIRRTASKSPGRGGREAGLDDVDLEARELAGDLELLGGGQAGAGRLLPVAQGRVEDADAARRHERPGRARVRARLIARRPGVVAAAWAWPAWTSTGLRNGIWARSRAPTCSIWWSRSAARSRSNSCRRCRSRRSSGRRTSRPGCRRGPRCIALADALVDDPRAAHVVAVLGGVADAEAHEVEAAAVHQVDDELELVHRLEVRELGLVAGLDERLEGHLDQRRRAAAQDGLLAEQVGLGLLLERRLEDAGAGVAERPGVGEDAARGRCPRRPARRRTGPARRRPPGRRSARGGPGPWARPSRRRRPPAGRSARSGC